MPCHFVMTITGQLVGQCICEDDCVTQLVVAVALWVHWRKYFLSQHTPFALTTHCVVLQYTPNSGVRLTGAIVCSPHVLMMQDTCTLADTRTVNIQHQHFKHHLQCTHLLIAVEGEPGFCSTWCPLPHNTLATSALSYALHIFQLHANCPHRMQAAACGSEHCMNACHSASMQVSTDRNNFNQ
jgi:hypothetical protein